MSCTTSATSFPAPNILPAGVFIGPSGRPIIEELSKDARPHRTKSPKVQNFERAPSWPSRTRFDEAMLHHRVRTRQHLHLAEVVRDSIRAEWHFAKRRWIAAKAQMDIIHTELRALENKLEDADVYFGTECRALFAEGITITSPSEQEESVARRSGFPAACLEGEGKVERETNRKAVAEMHTSSGTRDVRVDASPDHHVLDSINIEESSVESGEWNPVRKWVQSVARSAPLGVEGEVGHKEVDKSPARDFRLADV
ncbi:unnamed protein product [Somion occarium]|uniref:Uncharacterized protein n=1 Tax=Somion occarium TaxID=3059160 RepID=A0ABP1DKG2_9APHY